MAFPICHIQGVPKNPQNHWNNVLLKFECPNTNMAAMAFVELVPGEWVQTLY
jgi:hypothetical protein